MSKDREVSGLMEQNQRMQEEILKATEEMEDYKEKTFRRIGEMEELNSSLNEQVSPTLLHLLSR